MLLRRLAQSFRTQYWMAIAIEFVLLVAGVFLSPPVILRSLIQTP